MIFSLIVTAVLIALSMVALTKEFPNVPIYIAVSLLGLTASFWQQKNRPVPYLRALTNVIFIILTIKALLPFFRLAAKHDMFAALLQTWIYFLVISTFMIYKKRDYYIIQGLSLGLVIYACFYAVNNPLVLINVSVCFLAVWMMGLRVLSLLSDNKKQQRIISGAENLWREIKTVGIIFMAILFISLPFYFLIPRLNIPLLPLDELLKQRYSAIYADFPKRGLMIFLSQAPQKATHEKTPGGEAQGLSEKGQNMQIETSPNVYKPILWTSDKGFQSLLKELGATNQGLQDLGMVNKISNVAKDMREQQKKEQGLNQAKQELQENISSLQEQRQNLSRAASAEQEEEVIRQFEEQKKNLEAQIQQLSANLDATDKDSREVGKNMNKIREELRRFERSDVKSLLEKKEKLEKELVEKINNFRPEEQKQATGRLDAQALAKEIEKTNQELRDLAKENNLADVEENLREWEELKQRDEALSWAVRDLGERTVKMKEDYMQLAAQTEAPTEELKAFETEMQSGIETRQILDKELQKVSEMKDEIRNDISEQALQSQQPMLQVLWDKKEMLEKELAALIDKAKTLPPEKQKVSSELTPGPIKAEYLPKVLSTRRISILDIILYILILTIASYIIRLVLILFVPIIRHKKRIEKALRDQKHNLAISLIFNFLCRIFSFFGYKYPVEILPEEYSERLKEHFAHFGHDIDLITSLFIEARYSEHALLAQDDEAALICYRDIFQELKNRGRFWQRQLFKMRFLFEL